MSDLPEPLLPADVDLRHFATMPLDVQRLRDSDLAIEASDAEFRAAVLLWCAAWHQVPAGSLPNSPRALAQLAGFGRDVKTWDSIAGGALRGFVLCSDGRLYHQTLCEYVLESYRKSYKRQRRLAADRARKQSGTDTGPSWNSTGIPAEAPPKGKGGEEKTPPASLRSAPPLAGAPPPGARRQPDLQQLGSDPPRASRARGHRIPGDWRPSEDGMEILRSKGYDDDAIRTEADSFRDYWAAKTGSGASKLDWTATWRNWCRRAASQGGQRSPAGLAPGGDGRRPASLMAVGGKLLAEARARDRTRAESDLG
ncbi:MAG: hypothetical protein Kilf2KO_44640 [Rhodospirillales bacterium]